MTTGKVGVERRRTAGRSGCLIGVSVLLAACAAGRPPTVGGSGRPTTPSVASAGVSPSDTASTPVTLAGRIVFSMKDDIYTVNPDGSRLRRLTSRRGPEFDPSWSPDGSRVAYRDSRRGINQDDEIYVMRADGSHQANITRNPANEWGPAWSPDGTRIAFNSDREGVPQIYLMRPDGSGIRRLTTIEGEYPAWSPDGLRIAFMSSDAAPGGGPYDLYVMNADGSGLHQLTSAPGEDGWPAWSPDGTTIAFSSTRDDHGQSGLVGPLFNIYVMNPDGSGQTRVTERFGQFVTWSPDGRYLLVSPGGYVVRPDGSGLTQLPASRTGGGLDFADWQR